MKYQKYFDFRDSLYEKYETVTRLTSRLDRELQMLEEAKKEHEKIIDRWSDSIAATLIELDKAMEEA